MDLHLSTYDIVFLCIILVSAMIALFRGGIAELLSLSTWFIALFIMRQYQAELNRIIPQIITNDLLKALIRYVIAFIAVAIIVTVIKAILQRFVRNFGLSGLNYSIGFLFGIVRGVIICALIIIVLQIFHFTNNEKWQRSILAPLLTPAIEYIVQSIPKQVQQLPTSGITPLESAVVLINQVESLAK